MDEDVDLAIEFNKFVEKYKINSAQSKVQDYASDVVDGHYVEFFDYVIMDACPYIRLKDYKEIKKECVRSDMEIEYGYYEEETSVIVSQINYRKVFDMLKNKNLI